jgi:hypothetical protein
MIRKVFRYKHFIPATGGVGILLHHRKVIIRIVHRDVLITTPDDILNVLVAEAIGICFGLGRLFGAI